MPLRGLLLWRKSMNVPYNNGKIKIGCNYQPPQYVEYDSDMLHLQSCLLGGQKYAMLKKMLWKLYLFGVALVLTILWIKAR